MCGIFGYIMQSNGDAFYIIDNFKKIKHRGPDWSRVEFINDNMVFGFHRLAINDTSNSGTQPFITDDFVFVCNGEIYNHKELRELYGSDKLQGNSDCEIVPHMIMKIGIKKTLELINGEFAFLCYDRNEDKVWIANDHLGIRPLFYTINSRKNVYIASEIKAMGLHKDSTDTPVRLAPGSYAELKFTKPTNQKDLEVKHTWFDVKSYYELPKCEIEYNPDDYDLYLKTIRDSLRQAVRVRLECVESSEFIGFLLSGGLDSSLVCAISRKILGPEARLKTFSIGLKDSTDLEAARAVSTYLNTDHHECIITLDDMISSVEEVIYTIESFCTTSVRASCANRLLAHFIKRECPEIKVVLSGEGSDENFSMGLVSPGGYKYLSLAPNVKELRKESVKLMNEICMFDVTRADRCISSSNSLECRVPFLDKNFINATFKLPMSDKHYNRNTIEKKALRDAFFGHLPDNVLYRPKDAWSDSIGHSWVNSLQERYKDYDKQYDLSDRIPKPLTGEQVYYRKVFEDNFGKNAASSLFSHYWMSNPNWVSEKNKQI